MTTGTISGVINSITYTKDGGFGFSTDALVSGLDGAWKNTLTAQAGTFTSGMLENINLGADMEKVYGFSSGQIEDITQFNSVTGGLASSAVTYGLTGNVTFNLAKLSGTLGGGAWSTGLLEMNLGEDGFSLGLGSGGTDVSIGTLVGAARGIENWDKNIQIENAADKNGLSEAATALRVQWGFGDDAALAQLEEILKYETRLKASEGGSSIALTTLEDEARTVYLDNYTSNMSREAKLAMGITLQHEAYRDGIVDDNNSFETMLAVGGHTGIALRMANDPMYGALVKNIIAGDANLQADIAAYMTSWMTDDWNVFSGYVGGTYDSSADYWRLMEDGSLLYDGDGYLKDSNGNFILNKDKTKIGKKGIEGGLIEILGLSSEDAKIAVEMMKLAGMTEKGTGTWWNHEGNAGKSITLENEQYAEIYYASLSQHNTLEIYKKLVSSGRMALSGKGSSDKYISYAEYKANNFIIGGTQYLARNTFVDKRITTFLNVSGNLSPNPHRGTDSGVEKGTDSLLVFWNDTSRVVYSSADSEENMNADANKAAGLHATIATDISYNFKGGIVTDTLYFRTLHLDEVLVKTGDILSWDTSIGKTGNTGKLVTEKNPNPDPYGYHAHEEIYTESLTSPYLNLLTNIRNARSIVSYSDNYYYDKFVFADLKKYLFIDKGAYAYNK
jgi:hypothetical protein